MRISDWSSDVCSSDLGGIVFTSSVEAFIGCPYSTAYSASKAFVNNLGEGLWAELTPQGIDVLTLCPGATDTEAPARQGIDPATLNNIMSPDDVARRTLDHLRNGQVYVSSKQIGRASSKDREIQYGKYKGVADI